MTRSPTQKLVKLITDELNSLFKDKTKIRTCTPILPIVSKIQNSFLENRPSQTVTKALSGFQATEQGMLYGHPFSCDL